MAESSVSEPGSAAQSGAGACPHINLFDPATQEDWYPAYDELRSDAPVYRIPGSDTFVLTRYDDVVWVSKRTDLFANGPAPKAALMRDEEAIRIYREKGRFRRAPLSTDPPVHRNYRSLVDGFFTPRGAAKQSDMITKVVNELIDSILVDIDACGGSAEIEFVERFALPLPVIVITTMLGFPLEDMEQLKVWSEAWVMPFAGNLSPEQQRYVAEQGVQFQHYIEAIIGEKRRQPDDSVISSLAHATFTEVDGTTRPLTDEEIIFTTDHLYIGGNETTTFALTSGLWLLLQTPGLLDRLRADLSLVPQFVEEILRIESPTQGLFRHTLDDVELHGVKIPAGSTVHLRFGAANRDAAMFSDPAALDLDRRNSARHVAFGQGEHHCPGAGLSRLEQVIAFTALISRIDGWILLPRNDYRHKPGLVLRALEELHVGISTLPLT
jgi:cytochrome P450